MAFLESPRFPDNIAYGAQGGPGFSTEITELASGVEGRNARWSATRHSYEVGQVVRTKTVMKDLIAFFMIARGKANPFRYKDFADYEVSGSEGIVVALSDTTWQMTKRYTSGSSTFDRPIRKPVSGTTVVSGGGSYTIDTTTGIITKVSGASPTGFTCQFDVPARFDVDQMKHEIVSRNAAGELLMHWHSIPVIEVRV